MIVPDFSPLSWVALAVMAVAVAAGFTKKFLATGALLLANVAVFLITFVEPRVQNELALPAAALFPPHATGVIQLFSSMFVHEGPFHILGNMIFLWAFGMPFESRIGARRLMGIYLLSGVVGSVVQSWAMAGIAHASMLGASGAIFGIMCAFATKYPNQVIAVPVWVVVLLIRIPMRMVYGVLIYLGFELVVVGAQLANPLAADGIGHYAHLAGGAAGALLALTVLRHVPSVPGRGGPIAIDLVALGDFAQDTPTKEVLAHMRQNHDEPEVFQAWLDRFFRTATCPTCKHRVMPRHRGEVVCTQGHSFDVRQDRTQKLGPTVAAR